MAEKHSIPMDILDDLCSRFIINLPPKDRNDLVRICFQIELAHWFYLDNYCNREATDSPLLPCGIREFAAHIFQHVPELRSRLNSAGSLDAVLDNWREYKLTVPTYGAILLDEDLTHVLLVQSYWAKASWGFPKGKVNEGEEPWKCAVREVWEETGYNISHLINKREYIEAMVHDQVVRLYVVAHVPRSTRFQPQTRGEIRACQWFALDDLPAGRKDTTPLLKIGVGPNAFFVVQPFVKRMRRWVAERKMNARRTRHKPIGDIDYYNKTKPKISHGYDNEIHDYQQRCAYYYNRNGYGYINKGYGHGHGRRDKKSTKRQLFTPQTTPATVVPSVPSEHVVTDESEVPESTFFNFVAPSWAKFRFDMRAILDALD